MSIARDGKNTLSTEWENAWKDKNIQQLKYLLKQKFIPDNIHATLDFTDERNSMSIVDILLEDNSFSDDRICFKIVNKLILKGAKLPEPNEDEKNFVTTEDYFIHLVRNNHDLYIALQKKPLLIIEKDEKQQTLFHHAARIGHEMDSNSASLIHFLLFNSPHINFNTQDKNGNTPLHVAALNCTEPTTCKYVFPNYLKTAFITESDFEILNKQGQSILHIAARTTFENINNVEQVINCVPNIPLNTLSSSGSTALYYALNHLRLKEARTLLENGANPKIFGVDSEGQDRNPLTMINQHLERINSKIENPDVKNEEDNSLDQIEILYLIEMKKELSQLKNLMIQSSHAKTCTEKIIQWMVSFFSKNEPDKSIYLNYNVRKTL